MKHRAFLLLGSNLDDRLGNLHSACKMIDERVGEIVAQSKVYITEPWGVTNQPDYLNQVLEVETLLNPHRLLEVVLQIEQELGRTRYEQWHERLIDIDLLFYDAEVIHDETLRIPHPHLQERNFTLIPLAEIAPDFIHPERGVPVRTLLEQSPDRQQVEEYKG